MSRRREGHHPGSFIRRRLGVPPASGIPWLQDAHLGFETMILAQCLSSEVLCKLMSAGSLSIWHQGICPGNQPPLCPRAPSSPLALGTHLPRTSFLEVRRQMLHASAPLVSLSGACGGVYESSDSIHM